MTGAAPTLVMRDNAPWMTLGALGGTRMPTGIVNTIVGIVDHGLSAIEAVDAPRFHAESAWLEMESRLYWRFREALAARGWKLRPAAKGYDRAFALVFAALRAADGSFSGGSDPRGGGGLAIV